jgi:hypothetical protein
MSSLRRLSNVALNDVVEKKVPKHGESNFNVQRELPANFVFQVGYVGTHGYTLPTRYDTNLAATPNTADSITLGRVACRTPTWAKSAAIPLELQCSESPPRAALLQRRVADRSLWMAKPLQAAPATQPSS